MALNPAFFFVSAWYDYSMESVRQHIHCMTLVTEVVSILICRWYNTSSCTAGFIILSCCHVITLLCLLFSTYSHGITVLCPPCLSWWHAQGKKLLAIVTCLSWETILSTMQDKRGTLYEPWMRLPLLASLMRHFFVNGIFAPGYYIYPVHKFWLLSLSRCIAYGLRPSFVVQ